MDNSFKTKEQVYEFFEKNGFMVKSKHDGHYQAVIGIYDSYVFIGPSVRLTFKELLEDYTTISGNEIGSEKTYNLLELDPDFKYKSDSGKIIWYSKIYNCWGFSGFSRGFIALNLIEELRKTKFTKV